MVDDCRRSYYPIGDYDHPLTGNPERDQPARRKAIWGIEHCSVPIGSMVLVYMLTWLGYIDGIHVTIYSSTMDPMGYANHWFLRGRDTQWLSKLEVMGQSRRCIKLAFRWLSRMRVQRSLRWWWSWLDNWELFDQKWIRSPLLDPRNPEDVSSIQFWSLFVFFWWVFFMEEWRYFMLFPCLFANHAKLFMMPGICRWIMQSESTTWKNSLTAKCRRPEWQWIQLIWIAIMGYNMII